MKRVRKAFSLKPFAGSVPVCPEAFTARPCDIAGRWMTTPFSIKALGDSAYANGVNRIIYHRFTHQPWADDRYLPGMTMGKWGMHLDHTQAWWEFAKPWFLYQSRCQWMLQAGTFCADVLFFAGEQAPNTGELQFFRAPEGYDCDVCPADALYLLKVENGLVVAPGGVKYRLLALPPMEACSPDMMACVAKLKDDGAAIAWTKKPTRTPGLRWGREGDARVVEAADALWAKGIFECSPAEALKRLGVPPDVRVESNGAKGVQKIEWLHRADAEADWYFTAMPNSAEATAEISFRQAGRVPELWDAETGECAAADVWREENGRTYVTIPYSVSGSMFVVFRSNREEGIGNREEGKRNREEGKGNREEGKGNREEGGRLSAVRLAREDTRPPIQISDFRAVDGVLPEWLFAEQAREGPGRENGIRPSDVVA